MNDVEFEIICRIFNHLLYKNQIVLHTKQVDMSFYCLELYINLSLLGQ